MRSQSNVFPTPQPDTLPELTADARMLRTVPNAAYPLAAKYGVVVKPEDTERDLYRRVHMRLNQIAGRARMAVAS